jgi:coproporphyrinogen III oxidase-like Fe-S oxidoreductase
VEEEETLSQDQYILESLMLGFRTMEGIDLDRLPQGSHLSAVLRDLQKAGLVEVQGRKAIPTREGFLVADGLPLLLAP